MTQSISAAAATNGHHRSDLKARPVKTSVITPAEATPTSFSIAVPEVKLVRA